MSVKSLETKFRIDPFAIFRQQAGAVRAEKRRSKRVPYEALIQVAPHNDNRPPSQAEFEEVMTRDLSSTGISFYSATEPTSAQVVLKIGDAKNLHYLTAKVIRFQEGFFLRKKQFLIGCQFTGRIELVQE